MSNSVVNYFHSASLRQRYVDELDDALLSGRLRTDEQVWLQSLTRPSLPDDPDPVRVDRLVCGEASVKTWELAAALLLSHGHTRNLRLYLYTLAAGIEVFEDRQALVTVLRARFAEGRSATIFEAEKIDGDPFQAQMLAIVDHEVERIGQMTAQLKRMPSLYDASNASIARQLRETLVGMPVDPETHLLQIVGNSKNGDESIPVTQTLAQASFDDYCNVKIEEGFERRFLDAKGLPASSAEAALFSRALATAVDWVTGHYRDLLQDFWTGVGDDQRALRDMAIESLGDSWRRELYRCRHEGTLSSTEFKALQPLSGNTPSTATLRCSRMTIRVGYSNDYPLAGTFVVHPLAEVSHSIFWFSAGHKLVRFADLAALTAYFTTASGRQQLRQMLAINDQKVLLQEGQTTVRLEEVLTPVLADRIDSIIALQIRNLEHVTALSDIPSQVAAMVDDALDVRHLLDPRQSQFSAGRWRRDAPFNFNEVWNLSRSVASDPAPLPVPTSDNDPIIEGQPHDNDNVQMVLSASWRELTRTFDLRAERLRGLDNVLSDHAAQILQQYICVLIDGVLRVGNVRVQWFEPLPDASSDLEIQGTPAQGAQQLISMDLVALLLERVSGHRSRHLTMDAHVKFDESSLPGSISIEWVNHMLDRAVPQFIEGYLRRFTESRTTFQRQGDRHLYPHTEAINLRENALRLDLALAKRQGRLDRTAVDRVRQVLDRPVRSLRSTLGASVIEAYTVSLSYDDAPTGKLYDTMLLRQPSESNGSVILWREALGWQQFSSLAQLQETMQRELYSTHPERWLELLDERDRLTASQQAVRGARARLSLHIIDGHAMEALWEGVLDREQQNLRQRCLRALRCHFDADLFIRSTGEATSDASLGRLLDGLSMRVDNDMFKTLLPRSITSAPLEDLKLYYKIFTRFYLASDGGKDFLYGIPSLPQYARDTLITQMEADFPGQKLDPDRITVTSRRYVSAIPPIGGLPSSVPAATSASSESLTDYAINRFLNTQDTVLNVHSHNQPQAMQLLTPSYLRQLVRRLDVGTHYVALLRKALAPEGADYATRKDLFIRQLPPALLSTALPAKLEGTLSAQAYAFIASVLDMPDDVARELVDGVRVIISPLQLIADKGMAADTVTGVYVICPDTAETGPVVLYAMYHPPFIFCEYASLTALTDDIRRNESLQQLLLDRLDPEVHKRYVNGGFLEPHLPFSVESSFDVPLRAPGPVTVGITRVKGNALQFLFEGMVKLLVDMGVSNSVTNQQADQVGRAFLMTLGAEQALILLPGRWGMLVTLWQSLTLIKASATAASSGRWGKALSEFCAALGLMVSSREQEIEALPDAQAEVPAGLEEVPAVSWQETTVSDFSWRGASLDAVQRKRLQALEAQDVDLGDMHRDELLNLYLDKFTNTPYAAVAGKVYQVKWTPEEGRWTIVGLDGTTGPQLMLDSNRQWQLDLKLRLRGGGGASSSLRDLAASSSADGELFIEARGMPEIRLLYRDRARKLSQAHMQARRYLENCLDNLNLRRQDGSRDPRVTQIIGHFFGADVPDAALLNQVETAVKGLFDALMDPSLSPSSSLRFVVGSNRPGHERIAAFVIPSDPQRRVFLTEQFFRTPVYRLKPGATADGFNMEDHCRAATLIHELTHQVLDTKDIAYLESEAPYTDLVRGGNTASFRIRAQIQRLQENRLSHRTPEKDLFTQFEDGQWRDVMRKDARGFTSILRITETKDLAAARKVFLADVQKRSKVILKNADSVTLLVLRLGRYNHALSTS